MEDGLDPFADLKAEVESWPQSVRAWHGFLYRSVPEDGYCRVLLDIDQKAHDDHTT